MPNFDLPIRPSLSLIGRLGVGFCCDDGLAISFSYIIAHAIAYVITYVITYGTAYVITYVITYPYAWIVNFEIR